MVKLTDEHQTRKRWIKLWTQETLYGTTKTELAPDERGTWFLMLCKAGDSPVPGTICIDKDIAYSKEQLAQLFNISLELLERTEKKLVEYNKIHKNGTEIIEIVNWDKYQGKGDFDKTEYMSNYMPEYRKGKRRRNKD